MLNQSSTNCKAPRVWSVVSAYGDLKPCCAYRGNIGHIKNGGIDLAKISQLEFELKNNIKSKGCGECWHRESIGFSSHRLSSPYWNEQPDQIRFLEFSFSNLCNLKCRMCDGDSSSHWSKDEEALQQSSTYSFRYKHGKDVVRAFESEQHLISFLENQNLKKLERLTFKGGEPLLHAEVFATGKYLQQQNVTDILVQFTSNGTVQNEKLSYFQKFKEVEFTISVDGGSESVFKYIRGGHRHGLNDLIKQINYLEKLSGFKIKSNSCIMAYNIFHIADLMLWVHNNIRDRGENYLRNHFVSIDDPSYVSVLVIPKHLRIMALEENIKLLKRHHLYSLEVEKQISNLLQIEKHHDEEKLQQFVLFTKKVDELRGQNILEICPQYNELFSRSGSDYVFNR